VRGERDLDGNDDGGEIEVPTRIPTANTAAMGSKTPSDKGSKFISMKELHLIHSVLL
jgi:hypothetical protein